MNTVRNVALDKTPGVRPLGVGESWMWLWSDCSHTKLKVAVAATNACGNTQLCAGLRSGIEANLHAIQAIWPQSAGWMEDLGVEEEEEDGNLDASNGFNELNRYLMLWNVAHLWNQGSRFAFNRYRHWVRCLVRTEPGHPPLIIHSQEGITHSNCLAMSLYGVALMPLATGWARKSLKPYSRGTATTQVRLARHCPTLDASTSL